MNRVHCCMIIVVGLLSSRGAQAQPVAGPTPPVPQTSPPALPAAAISEGADWESFINKAAYGGYLVPIVPTLKVTPSSGKSDLQIGIDILRGLSPSWDLHVLPSLNTSVDTGSGELLSFSKGKLSSEVPWTLSATVALSKLVTTPEIVTHRISDRKAQLTAVRAAAGICLMRCSAGTITNDEQTFCQANPGQSPDDLADLDPAKLCDKGKLAFKLAFESSVPLAEDELREARMFPKWDISIGIEGGRSKMQYLEPQGDGAMMYSEASRKATSARLAFALIYVEPQAGRGYTFELPLSAGYRSDAQQTTGHYCPVIGSVGGAPIETCADRPVGAPDKNFVANAAALLGIADTDHGSWRVAAGPAVDYKSTNNEVHADFEIPIYLNTTPLIADKSQYQGIIRLTPTFGLSYDSKNGAAFEAVLTLDLLGQRNLFSRALDWKH